jgi:two-component system, OmpR family, sensor histidine kinase TctE
LKLLNSYSIQRKLRWTFLVIWISSVIVTTWVAFTLTDHVAGVSLDRILKDDALAIASQINWKDDKPKFGLDIQTADSLIFDSLSASHFLILNQDHAVIAGDLDAKKINIDLSAKTTEPTFFEILDSVNPLRAVGIKFKHSISQNYVWVFVAEPLSKRSIISRELASAIFLPAIALTFIVVPLIFFSIRAGLAPANTVSISVAARGIDDLSPISSEHVPEELKGFITHINDLLNRLQEAISHERRFIADAAHQLRTPVAGIKLLIDDLTRTHKADPTQAPDTEVLEELQRVSTRTAHLVKQLLNLARSDASEKESEEFFPVEDLSNDLKLHWQSAVHAAQKELLISSNLDQFPHACLKGNALLLSEALGNLIENSIRYGGSTINLELQLDSKRIHFKVSDNGDGIAEQEKAHIMTPFGRGFGDLSHEGAGLGLSIAINVIKKMGGRLDILSRPKFAGTLVYFSLPTYAKSPSSQQ